MNELGIRFLGPTPWGRINLIGKSAHSDWDGDALDVEKAFLRGDAVLPIQARRRHRRGGQPVQRDVVENVVWAEAFGLSVDRACEHRVTASIVIEYPSCETDG